MILDPYAASLRNAYNCCTSEGTKKVESKRIIKDLKIETLKEKFSLIMANRESIVQKLRDTIPVIQRQAEMNGIFMQALLGRETPKRNEESSK